MSQAASLRSDDQAADDESQRDELPPGVEVFRFEGPMFFGVATAMLDTLRRFIIDARSRGTEVRLCELNANTDTLASALAGNHNKP